MMLDSQVLATLGMGIFITLLLAVLGLAVAFSASAWARLGWSLVLWATVAAVFGWFYWRLGS